MTPTGSRNSSARPSPSPLARLETLRADLYWLKLRLLDPSAGALVQSTHRELGQRVGKARAAVDRAFAVAPEDPAVAAARVDMLRIAGEEKRAREWIAPVAQDGSDPGNAYVLAALDQVWRYTNHWQGDQPTLFDVLAVELVSRERHYDLRPLRLEVTPEGLTRPGEGQPNASVALDVDVERFMGDFVARLAK